MLKHEVSGTGITFPAINSGQWARCILVSDCSVYRRKEAPNPMRSTGCACVEFVLSGQIQLGAYYIKDMIRNSELVSKYVYIRMCIRANISEFDIPKTGASGE